MDGVDVPFARRCEDEVLVEIAVERAVARRLHRLDAVEIGQFGIGRAVQDHRLAAERPHGPQDPGGRRAAIGDEDALEHRRAA